MSPTSRMIRIWCAASLILPWASSLALAQWSDVDHNTIVSIATGHQTTQQIASGTSGSVIITWEDQRSSGYTDIYAQKLDAQGVAQWAEDGVAVCTATDHQEDPRIVSDGSGGAIITWNDYRSGSDSDIYAQRVDSDGVVQWTANGVVIADASGSQYLDNTGEQRGVAITTDGSGGAIIAWEDGYRTSPTDTGWDIYAQRVSSSGAISWGAGRSVCSALDDQLNPQLVSDGFGGAIVTWEHLSGNQDIYAQRVDSEGSPQWTADGVAISTASLVQWQAMIAADGSGGALITWRDSRNLATSGHDIYVQKVDFDGSPQWTADGVAVCNASYSQEEPKVISDGSGGAVIAWDDRRTDSDVYAQRVDSEGSPQWTADGVAISATPEYQEYSAIATDGLGGAFITWHDSRNGLSDRDIYAQRVDSEGSPRWTADGVAITTDESSQTFPEIAADGSGGAVITWVDGRNADGDLYAHKVTAAPEPGLALVQLAALTALGWLSMARRCTPVATGSR